MRASAHRSAQVVFTRGTTRRSTSSPRAGAANSARAIACCWAAEACAEYAPVAAIASQTGRSSIFRLRDDGPRRRRLRRSLAREDRRAQPCAPVFGYRSIWWRRLRASAGAVVLVTARIRSAPRGNVGALTAISALRHKMATNGAVARSGEARAARRNAAISARQQHGATSASSITYVARR